MRRWRLTTGMTEGEVAVIRALLPQNDPRSDLLLLQAVDAPEVRRTLVGRCAYRASITYVKAEKYLIDTATDIESPALMVKDELSGRKLTFRVQVLRGGFLGYLDGFADDGRDWPINWVPGMDLAPVVNWLAQVMSDDERQHGLRRLAEWAGIDQDKLAAHTNETLSINSPASSEQIIEAESRLKCRLPAQYREFVQICNGLAIRLGRPYEIFGTLDAYSFDVDDTGKASIVITSLYEEGAVLLSCEGQNAGTTVAIRPQDREGKVIGDLRAHVSDSLKWLDERIGSQGRVPRDT
jgi:hypothetical protein